ncbi:hypothetical protein [Bacillus sp. JJ1562]|uniref:hypothetical protein n=1 Tax=Bacillus sp. JJ1562 TaxID=3122960 RepID=UPI003001BBDB
MNNTGVQIGVRPKLKPSTHLIPYQDENLLIVNEKRAFFKLKDNNRRIGKILSSFNGENSIEEICDNLNVQEKTVQNLLKQLGSFDLLDINNSTSIDKKKYNLFILGDENLTDFCKDIILDRNPEIKISCINDGERIEEKLNTNIDVVLLLTSTYRNSLYQKVNDLCYKFNIPLLSGYVDGNKFYMGPFVNPNIKEHCCLKCTTLRILAASPFYDETLVYWDYLDKAKSENLDLLKETKNIITGLFVNELNRFLSDETPLTYSKQFEYDFTNEKALFHHVLKVPTCNVCNV